MSKHNTVQNSLILFFCVLTLSLLFFAISTPIYSQSVDELENIIQEKEEELNKQKTYLSDIEKRIKEIGSSNYTLTEQVNLLNKEIVKLQTEIDKRNSEIEEKLKIIDEKQKLLSRKKESLDLISAQLYMQSRYNDGQFLFSFSTLNEMLKTLFVKKSAINFLKEDIEEITGEFVNLVELKKSLEDEKAQLDKEKKELDQSYALVAAEKSRVQKELNAQIAEKSKVKRTINGISAELSSMQYQLLLSRQGGTYVNPDSVPSGGDYWGSLDGFKDAPSGSFAVYSIGAYTHRNGMSQWGAKARAERGANYEAILRAYYLGINFATEATDGIKITVKFCDKVGGVTKCNVCPNERYATYDFETDYLYRLGEMPESFHIEALKAQAIAARTYALNATNYGRNNPIRGDECGQAIGNQKLGRWKEAVDSTRGITMQKNGAVFSSQYAAINGGWIDNPSNLIGWDTTDKAGNDINWISRAWDTLSETGRIGTYYWFYKTWYRSGYSVGTTVSSSSCNRTPWLNQAEMADILNAYQVWKANGGSDTRIVPIPDACHPTANQIKLGYNPYSFEELKRLASKPVSKVNSVLVKNSNGWTSEVIFQTDAEIISMTGNEFKTIYNLRAPGYLRIPQGSDRDAFWHFEIRMKK